MLNFVPREKFGKGRGWVGNPPTCAGPTTAPRRRAPASVRSLRTFARSWTGSG
jgi:hypothetical protein